MNDSEHVLPHNLDAERAILGSVLLRNAIYSKVTTILNGPEFYREAHQRIYEVIIALVSGGGVADLITVQDELTRRQQLEEVGGPVYLSALVDGIPSSLNVESYAEIVVEKYRLRLVIAATKVVARAAYEGEATSTMILDRGVQELLSISSTRPGQAPIHIRDLSMEYLNSLDDKDVPLPIPTGFADLDDMLDGGFRPADLVIVAGRPSMGKTAFGTGIGVSAAQHHHATAIFSLEMKRMALAARIMSGVAKVDATRLRKRVLTDSDFGRLSEAYEKLREAPLLIQDVSSSLLEIAGWAERLNRMVEGGLKLLVIDYIQLMTGFKGRSLQEEVANKSAALKRLASDLGIPVVALSQLSRAPEGRADKRPQLSDLRDSGALEQDADIAILIYREEFYKQTPENTGMAEAILAKQRDGPTGVVNLAFIKALGQFANLAPEQQPV